MSPAPITPDLQAFLESGISILVGTRDARLFPEAVRGVGARVEPGGEEVTVFVPAAVGGATLANLRENGRVAVCFTRVDHRAVQLKGRAVEVREAVEAEREEIDRYRCGLAEQFAGVGLPSRTTLRIAHWPAFALRFRVQALFVQTPGPGAGEPLGAAREGAPA